jgi:hypothetical protein
VTDQLERIQRWLVEGERSTRRRFLIRVGQAGFSTVAALAGLTALAQRADANTVECCHLSYTTYCAGSVCPPGCNCYEWTCCAPYSCSTNQTSCNCPAGGGCQCKYRCGECYAQNCSYIQQIGPCPGGRCPQIAAA